MNKTVLITGSASGIGLATAKLFAQNGYNIFMTDIDTEKNTLAADEIKNSGGSAYAFTADVRLENEVSAAVGKCVEVFGSLDCAFNNAGIVISKNTVSCTEEIWDKIIDTNLKGYWLCMKHELIQMQKQGHGNIVNTSSISGLIARAGDMPYNVSKFGIVGLTKTAALENADKNIRINCICPGAVQTPWVKRVTKGLNELQPMGRIAQPEEIAQAVLWLCSDNSSFMTGHALVLDGGRIAGEW
jgi:NAD(P)-dependent dehydrogenase (short-subunit alcohol dehydrogenase family)